MVARFDNFSTKFATYATTFGFVQADATAVRNDYIWLAFSVLQVDLFKTETSERVAYKNLLRDGPIGEPQAPYPSLGTISFPVPPVVAPGIIPRLRATVQRIKAHPAYTEAAGQDLGIIGPAHMPPTPTKPLVAAAALPNCCVKVTFKKASSMAWWWKASVTARRIGRRWACGCKAPSWTSVRR